jgi:hypothetical protein
VVVGDGGTPIKHHTPSIVQVLFRILFSFLLGVVFGAVFGKESLHSFIMWAIFGVSKHDEL